ARIRRRRQRAIRGPMEAGRSKPARPARLHPEDAELRRLDRSVERGGDAEAQYAARIGRVDDAVVPQPRGGVPGAALVLVLLADRRLERFLVLGAPAFAPGLDAVAA